MKDSEVVAGMAGGARAQRHAGRRRGRLLRSRGGAERPASGGGLPRAGPGHGRVHGVGRRGALSLSAGAIHLRAPSTQFMGNPCRRGAPHARERPLAAGGDQPLDRVRDAAGYQRIWMPGGSSLDVGQLARADRPLNRGSEGTRPSRRPLPRGPIGRPEILYSIS